VLDWIQQGRLLGEDQIRSSGTKDWVRIGENTALSAYLPREEPLRANDQAEALEPVELDFHWQKPQPDEDDEVDMIPLIDVSMVLLVFFMMTAGAGGAAAFIKTPAVETGSLATTSGIWIGINLEGEGKDRTLVYSLGEEGKPSADERDRRLLNKADLMARFDAMLEQKTVPIDVTVNAHQDVEDGQVVDIAVELSKASRRGKIKAKFIGVTEKK
jgi:biopolymer transport protein ExbD